MTGKIIFIYFLFFTLILNYKILAKEDIEVSIDFEPTQLTLGRQGLLTITVSGTQNVKPPTLPNVDGLHIKFLNTQSRINMYNGNISMEQTYSFAVMPKKIGEFSIPNFEWKIDGKKFTVESPTKKLFVQEGIIENDILSLELEINLNESKIYVGQMVPVSIVIHAPLHFPGNLKSLPEIQGNSFNNHGYIGNSSNKIEKINGVEQQAASFPTYITPLKSGDETLEYKVGLIMQVPKATMPAGSNALNFYESIFGGAMFNDIEEVELKSKPKAINVLPLPENGRPDNFTGAIGQFTIESFSATPEEVQVGDPITVKMVVKGSGNMDRISSPILITDNNWKSYKPKSSFNKEDLFGFTGTKTFEFIIIPQNEQINQTPPISFSFFNPKLGRYSELTPNSIPLKITTAPKTILSNELTNQPQRDHSNSENNINILPIKLEIKKSVKSLISPICNKIFTPSLIGISVIIGIFLIYIKRRNLENKQNTAYIKQLNIQKAIQINLQKVQKSYSKKNAEGFYHAASMIILEIAAKKHNKTSQTLSTDEVIEFFEKNNLNQEALAFIKIIFDTTDLLKFSGINNEEKLEPNSLSKFESLINELENHFQ